MKPSRAEFSLASSKKRTQPSSTRRIFPAVSGYVGYIGKAALSLLPSEFHTRRSLWPILVGNIQSRKFWKGSWAYPRWQQSLKREIVSWVRGRWEPLADLDEWWMAQKQTYKGPEIFLRRNWLVQLWRLTSPKICRVSQPAGGPGDLMCSSSPVTHRLKAQEEPMLPLKTE